MADSSSSNRHSTPRPSLSPPIAKRIPHTYRRASGDVEDHYAWLADRDDPDTIAYLEAENAFADQYFHAHTNLVEAIYDEIRSRTQETDQSAPVQVDDWYYLASTVEGSPYPIFRRGTTAADADAQLVLDLNVEAADSDYFDLGGMEVSPDHTTAAWTSDTSGDERYDLKLRDIESGTDTDEQLSGIAAAGLAWSRDGQFLFYVTPDDAERPCRVWRHQIGARQGDDVEVFFEPDEAFYVGIGTTRNDKAIIIHSGSKTTTESWLLDPARPLDEPVCIAPRTPGIDYQVDHWGDRLVALTNDDAVDFRVVQSLDAGEAWEELLPAQPGRRIAGLDAFADFLALYEWFEGQEQIRIVFRDGSERILDIDDQPHEVGFGANEQWETEILRLSHQSLTAPPRTIDIDIRTDEVTVVKQRPTPNIDLDDYRSQRLWTTTGDDTSVPVDIVYHVDTPIDGTAPCTLYGYGAYEISLSPWFSVARLSLLDRGHVWALVHPRGGGEMGRSWYLDGKLEHKKNTFTDTLAVADDLVERGICAPDKMTIRGGSAGGLLVGACVTMRPERFAAAVAEVPFVDVVTTMSDPSLPLTVTEWEEWGDPRSEPAASYIGSYSPYDNTTPADYPAMLLTAGLNDPRVGFHEPAKWTAKLRHHTTGTRPIVLKTEMGAGHGGPSGRYDAWRDEARTLAFVHAQTGRPESSISP